MSNKKVVIDGNGIDYSPKLAIDKKYAVQYLSGDKIFNEKEKAVSFYKRQRLPKSIWIISPFPILLEFKYYENT